jgi:hypothetical protein
MFAVACAGPVPRPYAASSGFRPVPVWTGPHPVNSSAEATVENDSTLKVGRDIHKDSITVPIAEHGRGHSADAIDSCHVPCLCRCIRVSTDEFDYPGINRCILDASGCRFDLKLPNLTIGSFDDTR